MTTPEEFEVLMKKYYDAKKADGNIKMLGGTESAPPPEPLKSGCYNATLADKFKVIANCDTGADHSALSLEHLKELGDSGAFIEVLTTRHPVRMTLAMGTNDSQTVVESNQQAKVSVTLSTANGPLTLRNVKFLVFNHEMDEVIL